MNDDIKNLTGMHAVIEAARGTREAAVISVSQGVELEGTSLTSVPMVAVPTAGGGVEMQSVKDEIDAYRETYGLRPVRRRGTAKLEEQASFVDHANRFKDEDSAIFVSGGATVPTFTSVLNYHQAGGYEETVPRFGDHRGVFTPKFSTSWDRWRGVNGKSLSQADFATLITDHCRDILDVSVDVDEKDRTIGLADLPSWFANRHGRGQSPHNFFASSDRMLEISEGLTMSVNESVTDAVRRDTGETSIAFSNSVETAVAGVKVEVPVAFVLELPIFDGGALYQLPVRVRFAKRRDGDMYRAQWTLTIFGANETVLLCVDEMRKDIGEKTKLPVLAGLPE